MTALEAVDILYAHLKQTLMSAAGKPNGGLYRLQRPLNSRSEDVVVNALPMGRTQLQQAVLNVNCYVPNLNLSGDTTQPDSRRLTELGKLASDSISEVWGAGYQFNVQQDMVFPDEHGQYYINLRIEFRAINL